MKKKSGPIRIAFVLLCATPGAVVAAESEPAGEGEITAGGIASPVSDGTGRGTSTGEPILSSEAAPSQAARWRAMVLAEALQQFERQKEIDAEAPAAPAEVSIFVRKPVDPDVVVLEPLTVTDRFDDQRFELAMEWEYTRTQAPRRRWGTGAVTRDIGKVRVGVISILYVPVLFGLSW